MKIDFEKLGHIFKPSGDSDWSRTHAQVPFPIERGDRIRIYFATRDQHSCSSVTFIEVSKQNPLEVLYVHDQPCLSSGLQGEFDETGAMPSWFLEHDDEIWLYYTGWNKSETASYRLSIGLATSRDGGLSFKKKYAGPILDRGPADPIWVAQPCVIRERDQWRMWYLSCQKILEISGHPEPFYNVKYATSKDGISWRRTEQVCLDFDATTDAIGRPFVWKQGDRYLMLHSNRKAEGYRSDPQAAYRIEVSTSVDGINWTNCRCQIVESAVGWDSVMNEYASYLPTSGEEGWVFYNGLGFGHSGFGLARLRVKDL